MPKVNDQVNVGTEHHGVPSVETKPMPELKAAPRCSCTATPLPPKSLRQLTVDVRIDFCPLHATAPELYEALNKSARRVHMSHELHMLHFVTFEECPKESCTEARAALAKVNAPKE